MKIHFLFHIGNRIKQTSNKIFQRENKFIFPILIMIQIWNNAKPVFQLESQICSIPQWNHAKLPVSHKHPELNIVQSNTSWILSYCYQCKTNSITYVEQEIDFQFGITPVSHIQQELYIMKSIWLALKFYISIINAKPVLLMIPFPIWNRK